MGVKVFHEDNLEFMRRLYDGFANLVYSDPPYNTGKTQKLHKGSYLDKFDNYKDFIMPRIEEMWRILAADGTLIIHLDYREVHYVKVWMDEAFGRDHFMNEVIWAYDYGARSRVRWSPKHDNLLIYVKDPTKFTFNYEDIERIPYMAPNLVGAEKAARGKVPTDTIWHTIVPTNGKERTGYPTQKPMGLLRMLVRAHSNPGDMLLDPFAGSGTLGAVALETERSCTLIDSNPDAIAVMAERLGL